MPLNKRIKLESENNDDDDDDNEEQEEEILNGENSKLSHQNHHQQQQQNFNQQQQMANNFSTLYTALTYHLQNQSATNNNGLRPNQMQDLFARLPFNNILQSQLTTTTSNDSDFKIKQKSMINSIDLQIKMNLKYQEDLKSQLVILSAAEQDEQMKFLVEQLKKQLNELAKKQNELLNEQIKLKNDDVDNDDDGDDDDDEDEEEENENDEQLDDVKSIISSVSSTKEDQYDNKVNNKRSITGNLIQCKNDNNKRDDDLDEIKRESK